MPVVIDDHTWYRTVRISANTLPGWPKEGIVSDVEYPDCRDLRLFNEARVEAIKTKTNHVTTTSWGG